MTDIDIDFDLDDIAETAEQRITQLEARLTDLSTALDTAHTESLALHRALEDQRLLTFNAEAEVTRVREEGETKLQQFIDRASEILGSEADDHDLCESYDNIAERAGLRRRIRAQDVEIKVTYRQTISVMAHTWEEACDNVREKEMQRRFVPPTPFGNNGGIRDYGAVYSLSVEVSD